MTDESLTPITRAGVEAAYRFLLGRPPESEKAYEDGLAAGSVEALRRRILHSEEFAQRLARERPFALRRWMLDEMQAPPPDAAAEGPPRIVFLHIMKTAGSSVRRRLIELAGDAPVWRREEHGRPGDAPQAELARHRVLMGHFGIHDARHVPAPRFVFTVLRDPRERLVSLYHFLSRHREEVARSRGLRPALVARACGLEAFLANPDPLVQDQVRNVITRTLAGEYRPVGPDRYAQAWESAREAITGGELLRRAIANLLALDFVTFTDRLEEDWPRMMAKLGLPDAAPLPRENTRDLVSDILEPRDPPEITPGADRLLNRLTDLDRVLVRLARQICP